MVKLRYLYFAPYEKSCLDIETSWETFGRNSFSCLSMADLLDHGGAEDILPSLWPEDTVEYRIHCCADALGTDGNAGSLEDALSRLAVECNYVSKRLSGDHVWHYAPFYLRPEIGVNTYSLA